MQLYGKVKAIEPSGTRAAEGGFTFTLKVTGSRGPYLAICSRVFGTENEAWQAMRETVRSLRKKHGLD